MANKISDFVENTTKVFSGVITHNGTNPDTTGDTVRFMVKEKPNDTDADSIINVVATGLGLGGIFTITLTQVLTTITVRSYYYELLWIPSGTENYPLDSGIIIVKDKMQDNL